MRRRFSTCRHISTTIEAILSLLLKMPVVLHWPSHALRHYIFTFCGPSFAMAAAYRLSLAPRCALLLSLAFGRDASIRLDADAIFADDARIEELRQRDDESYAADIVRLIASPLRRDLSAFALGRHLRRHTGTGATRAKKRASCTSRREVIATYRQAFTTPKCLIDAHHAEDKMGPCHAELRAADCRKMIGHGRVVSSDNTATLRPIREYGPGIFLYDERRHSRTYASRCPQASHDDIMPLLTHGDGSPGFSATADGHATRAIFKHDALALGESQ